MPSILPGFRFGFHTWKNSATSLGINAGCCADDAAAVYIEQTANNFFKGTGGAWAAGNGSNGLGPGVVVAAGAWLYVFAIINGGNPDYYFDSDAAGSHAPGGTTAKRWVWAFRLDANGEIEGYKQKGLMFIWDDVKVDESRPDPGTARHFVTVSAPPGVPCRLLSNVIMRWALSTFVLWTNTDQADVVPDYVNCDANKSFSVGFPGWYNDAYGIPGGILPDANGQVCYRLDASEVHDYVKLRTRGWELLVG